MSVSGQLIGDTPQLRKAPGFRLYLITDRKSAGEEQLLEKLEAALEGGVKAIQLREKELHSRALLDLALYLRKLTSKYGAKLFVNDRLDVTLSSKADGVHLPEDAAPISSVRTHFPSGIIGRSVHSIEGAVAAQSNGADFITSSPIYATPSKNGMLKPRGLKALTEVARAVKIPVFALGGITPDNASSCIEAGAFGVAAISAVLKSSKTAAVLSRFRSALGEL